VEVIYCALVSCGAENFWCKLHHYRVKNQISKVEYPKEANQGTTPNSNKNIHKIPKGVTSEEVHRIGL